MCEIFPEVENCCFLCSIRVGMLFIAVFSITTGAASLGVVEQRTDFEFNKAMSFYNESSQVRRPNQVLSLLSGIISSAITLISVIFILAGLMLLYADLADEEGFAQIFVWSVFLNVVLGAFLIMAIALECVTQKVCLLHGMDWLSGATFLVMMVFFLAMWFYFICVANSYVIYGYT